MGPLDYSFAELQDPGDLDAGRGGRHLQPETTLPPGHVAGGRDVQRREPRPERRGESTARRADRHNLRSPDLIGIEEVQDNNGETNNGVVDAYQTWNLLIAAIQAAGGPTYQYRQIDPVDNQDGGAPGGNIRVGFLFRTDRGLNFVDRPGGARRTPPASLRRWAAADVQPGPDRPLERGVDGHAQVARR